MYWINDACDYCGEFKRVSLDNIDSKHGFALVCESCREMLGSPSLDDDEDTSEKSEKFAWRFVH